MNAVRPIHLAHAFVAAAAVAVSTWRAAQLWTAMKSGEALALRARPFHCVGRVHAPKVLVVGDSTAVGTGAGCPEESIAGRLGRAFPDVTIVNRGCNGAKTLDVVMQLAGEDGARYDLVLVHVGGNDVLRGTPQRVLAPQVDTLMRLARRLSHHVVVTTIPNIGLLPMFFVPLSWVMSYRSGRLCTVFAQAAREHGVHYVDFFDRRATHPFYRDQSRYFAQDKLHPSTDCYAYVYEALVAAAPIAEALTRQRVRAVH
jgi:lysophospholipase L1-like esterase